MVRDIAFRVEFLAGEGKRTAGPTSDNKKVAACAHFVRSGERDTEPAPATSERYRATRGPAGENGLTRQNAQKTGPRKWTIPIPLAREFFGLGFWSRG